MPELPEQDLVAQGNPWVSKKIRGAFLLQHTLEGGTPNKHILGAWWKACVVSGV